MLKKGWASGTLTKAEVLGIRKLTKAEANSVKTQSKKTVVLFHLLFFEMPHLLTLSSIRNKRHAALPKAGFENKFPI